MTVAVRVGIVSYNTAALLDRCLAALPAALDGLDAEVVVVDNASGDGSADVAARHAGVTVLRNDENVGYAKAMNRALAGTDAPVLLALNPDAEPPPGSLARLVAHLEAQADVGLVVPRLANADGSLQHSVYRFPSVAVAGAVGLVPGVVHRPLLGRRYWLEGGAPHDRATDIDWAIGAVHCIRAAALAGEVPYRERWFMYVEDLDLSWRLHRKGWRVRFEPDVTVPHVGNAAGAVTWGESRTARWLDATYDWYGLERGTLAARAWAAVNVVGVVLKWLWARIGLALRFPGADHRRWWAGQLRLWAPIHLRKLVGGPNAPLPGVTAPATGGERSPPAAPRP